MMHYVIAILALIAVWLLFSLHGHHPQQAGIPHVEQSYYEQVFDYTMDNIPAGSHFDWQTYDARGSIAVTKAFVSKSGYTCRSFAENYSAGGTTKNDKGYGCKRIGRNGWCKLGMDNALTCAMENPSYHVNTTMMSMPDAPGIYVGTPDISGPDTDNDVNFSRPASGNSRKPSANDAADTITNGAGSAAGYIAKNAGSWFSSIFR